MADGTAPRIFSATIYASCQLCRGSGTALGETCRRCADPDPTLARKVLERLTIAQMTFLRAFGHTLAEQPITAAEHDALCRCEYFVEDDDGVYDDEAEAWLIPPTCHWFAHGHLRFGACGTAYFVAYSPLGLLLREALMCGADTWVRHESMPSAAAASEPVPDGDPGRERKAAEVRA